MTFVLAGVDCSRSNATSTTDLVPRSHAIGTWAGSGDHTIGFTSNSGRFRVQWDSQLESGATDGRLHVTLHSGVSGRPLRELIEQDGAGSGAVNVEDDPRQFDLLVRSAGLDWRISVDEVVLVRPGT
ncbi:MAG: hypothetical protein R2712_29990 [Vicinamibacterales bacterium]